MAVVGAKFQQERQQQENLRDSLYIAAVAVFAFIWMLPVLWTVVTSLRPEPALQRNLASLIPHPFTHRELDIHPRERSTVEMDGQ